MCALTAFGCCMTCCSSIPLARGSFPPQPITTQVSWPTAITRMSVYFGCTTCAWRISSGQLFFPYIWVCLYVCECQCMCECVDMYPCVTVHTCMHVCECMRVGACVGAYGVCECMCVSMHVWTFNICMHVCECTCVGACVAGLCKRLCATALNGVFLHFHSFFRLRKHNQHRWHRARDSSSQEPWSAALCITQPALLPGTSTAPNRPLHTGVNISSAPTRMPSRTSSLYFRGLKWGLCVGFFRS